MKRSKLVVMVVDDAVEWRLQLAKHLEAQYFVVAAANGTEALEYAKLKRPDLIFLDVMMPQRNGFEVCQTVKQEWGMQNIHIVLLTAKGQESDKLQGQAVGADTYMTKPFDPDALLAYARQVLSL